MGPRSVALLILVSMLEGAAWAQLSEGPEQIVRRALNALADGNTGDLVALFSPDAIVFDLPRHPDRLVGERAPRVSASSRPSGAEILDTVAVGDLIAVSTNRGATGRPDQYALGVYRIREGRIRNLWHIAEGDTGSRNSAMEVIRRLVDASNKGDAKAFLPLFSPEAKIFRASEASHGLADVLSERMSREESRRDIITGVFAKGSPGQAEIIDILSVGDLVVSHDRVTLPTGQLIHQMKIYRVQNGVITHDWTAYEQPQ